MKKYFSLSALLVVILFNTTVAKFDNQKTSFMLKQINNSTQSTDTIKYLKDYIITRKAKFQHQTLDLLLKELTLPVKSYSIVLGRMPDKNIRCLVLIFDDVKTSSKKRTHFLDVPFLNVYFENEVPYKTAMSMYIKTFGDWTETEKEFYGKRIVKDIEGLQERKK